MVYSSLRALLPTVALFAITSVASVRVTTKANITTYDIHIEGINNLYASVEGEGFVRPEFRGIDGYEGILWGGLGAPNIPVVRFYVDGWGEIKISHGATIPKPRLSDGILLMPATILAPKFPGAREKLAPLSPLYSSTTFLPQKKSEVSLVGSTRGGIRRLVTLFPYQYNPSMGQTKLTPDFRVTFARKQPSAPSSQRQAFVFVIGTEFQNSPSLMELADFKRQLGFDVRFLTRGIHFHDALTLREQLRDLHARKEPVLKHVLIIGSHQGVPAFSTSLLRSGRSLFPFSRDEGNGITDHYFRALGSINYEEGIGTPDISVGRISVHNETELAVVVAKHLRYEKGDFSDPQWLQYWSFIASDDNNPAHWRMAEGTHEYVLDTYTRARGFLGKFPNSPEPGGDRLFAISHQATGQDVIHALQHGRGLIAYGGHGGPYSWDGPRVSSRDLLNLTHPEALPVVISHACYTAQFSNAFSFGEMWQRSPHGSIFFWGSHSPTFWDRADDLMARRMYDAIFRDQKLEIGEFTAYTLADYWRYYGGAQYSKYYWETYVTLGDPSMEIRTQAPRRVNISVPKSLQRASPSLSLRVTTEEDNALEGVRVGLSPSDGRFGLIARTDREGRATFHLPTGYLTGQRYVSVSTLGNNTIFSRIVIPVE